jgi:hypothetical protein
MTTQQAASPNDPAPIPPDAAGARPDESVEAEMNDPAGVLGMLIGMAAIACLLVGILIPFFPWLLAGVLGVIMLFCAFFSTTKLRWWILAIAILALIPPTILIIVQSLPQLQQYYDGGGRSMSR